MRSWSSNLPECDNFSFTVSPHVYKAISLLFFMEDKDKGNGSSSPIGDVTFARKTESR